MEKGTIFKNNYAHYETYFIYQSTVSKKYGSNSAEGYSLMNIDGDWILEKIVYYKQDLEDSEKYPVVGHVDIDELIKKELLKIIKGE